MVKLLRAERGIRYAATMMEMLDKCTTTLKDLEYLDMNILEYGIIVELSWNYYGIGRFPSSGIEPCRYSGMFWHVLAISE